MQVKQKDVKHLPNVVCSDWHRNWRGRVGKLYLDKDAGMIFWCGHWQGRHGQKGSAECFIESLNDWESIDFETQIPIYADDLKAALIILCNQIGVEPPAATAPAAKPYRFEVSGEIVKVEKFITYAEIRDEAIKLSNEHGKRVMVYQIGPYALDRVLPIIFPPEMEIVCTKKGYDFYKGKESDGREVYNIVPEGSLPPDGGYYSADYICRIKGIKNPF